MASGSAEPSRPAPLEPGSAADLILAKLVEFKNEAAAQRQADKAEARKALQEMAARFETQEILSDDDEPRTSQQPKKQTSNARTP